MHKPINVQGVGKHSQAVTDKVGMPGRLEDGTDIVFDSPVVPNSDIPALLGMRTLQRLHGIVDCRKGQQKLYLGSDVEIKPGPKTKVLQLREATSGHLLLPVSRFDMKPGSSMRFLLDPATANPATTTTSASSNAGADNHSNVH